MNEHGDDQDEVQIEDNDEEMGANSETDKQQESPEENARFSSI